MANNPVRWFEIYVQDMARNMIGLHSMQ